MTPLSEPILDRFITSLPASGAAKSKCFPGNNAPNNPTKFGAPHLSRKIFASQNRRAAGHY
jgi:hypothetical protein